MYNFLDLILSLLIFYGANLQSSCFEEITLIELPHAELLQLETLQTVEKGLQKNIFWLPSTTYYDELLQLETLKMLEKVCKMTSVFTVLEIVVDDMGTSVAWTYTSCLRARVCRAI